MSQVFKVANEAAEAASTLTQATGDLSARYVYACDGGFTITEVVIKNVFPIFIVIDGQVYE